VTSNLKKRIYTSFILFFLVFLIFRFNFILVYSLLILGIFSILEFLNISSKIFKKKFFKYSLNLIFIFYVFLFSSLLIYFFNFFQLKILIFIILFGCISSDIGGYIVGNILKGPKLTKISPKKTIAGALGSILLTNLSTFILFFYLTGVSNLNIILIATITSISCQLGDLMFSFLKRKAKIKDTGNFFPGHGGVLDRLDGILLGVPVGIIVSILYI
tara:strand:+ start:619 stop:1266 length:648 start_codon:yes stop_codon:yes gene_type:complete